MLNSKVYYRNTKGSFPVKKVEVGKEKLAFSTFNFFLTNFLTPNRSKKSISKELELTCATQTGAISILV